jgi:hypothetical protein
MKVSNENVLDDLHATETMKAEFKTTVYNVRKLETNPPMEGLMRLFKGDYPIECMASMAVAIRRRLFPNSTAAIPAPMRHCNGTGPPKKASGKSLARGKSKRSRSSCVKIPLLLNPSRAWSKYKLYATRNADNNAAI